MPASYLLANALLEHQVGKTDYAMPQAFVGLSSTTPTLAGGNVTEPSGGSYARVATTGATWGSAASGAIANAAAIVFTQASADWLAGADLTHAVLFDAVSGGNVLAYGALATPKAVLNGDTASIGIGDLDITLA